MNHLQNSGSCFFPSRKRVTNQAARQSSVRIHGEMLGQCSAACDAWAGAPVGGSNNDD